MVGNSIQSSSRATGLIGDLMAPADEEELTSEAKEGGAGPSEIERPLQDLRVLAIEQYAAGPFATEQLVDLGADIIKIEQPETGGDVGRYVPPHRGQADSLFFQTFNRGKRSIALDIDSKRGKDIFRRLVAHSDVVFGNVRGDVPARLGLRYEDLEDVNPRIVCCFITAFGVSGSTAQMPGYDYVVQGRAGWMSLTGEPAGPPERCGVSIVDYASGFAAATAILAGVHSARRTGRGGNCEVALFDVAISSFLTLQPGT